MEDVSPRESINFEREMFDKRREDDPNAIYADNLREEKINNIIAQLNPQLLLDDIAHRIRGEKQKFINGVFVGWEYIDKDGERISEELVQNFIAFLNSYLTQNVSMSNFSTQEINNIMQVVYNYIGDDLCDNSEKYGLTKVYYIEKEVTVYDLEPYINEEGLNLMKRIPRKSKQLVKAYEEVTDYNSFTRIGHIICQSTFAVLKQAQNGMLASRIFKALRVNETLNNGGNQKSKLDVLKFW